MAALEQYTRDIKNDPVYQQFRKVARPGEIGQEIEWTADWSLGNITPKEFRAMKRTSPPDPEKAARTAKRRAAKAAASAS